MEVANYELMIIGNPKLEAEQILSVVDKTLKDANSADIKVDKLGRKNLTFPIAKFTEGEYMVFNFGVEKDKVSEIDRKLRLLAEEILRYFLVKTKKPKAKVASAPKLEEKPLEKPVAKIDVKADTGKKGTKGTKVSPIRPIQQVQGKQAQGKQVSKGSKKVKAKKKE